MGFQPIEVNLMRLAGKVALITGGSQGIGEAIAVRFAQEGASVAVVASTDRSKAETVVQRIRAHGGRGSPFVCDVRDPAAVREVAAAVWDHFDRIDILVNSAGVFYPTPVGATECEASDRMIDVNLKGTWNAIDAVAPSMKAQGAGKIVNMASVAGLMGHRNYAIYSATKAAIVMMTRSLACELAGFGINVNCIAPGNTETPMNEAVRTQPEFRPFLDSMAARTPSGRTYSAADDMAAIAAFLASDEARAMHGSCVLADEGFSAGI